MTERPTLTAFLLARLAEDEAEAQRATARRQDHLWVVTGMDNAVGVDYNPARVLADVEAKRRIVGLHPEMLEWCQGCAHEVWPCRTLRALASVYAAHPDYRDEWRR